MFKRTLLAFVVSFVLAMASTALGWPNAADEEPCLAMPNDGGYQGQWNLWSFVPGPHMPEACPDWVREDWTTREGFREEEIQLGAGIHADRAWQITTGDRRVVVAVLDSGVYWDNTDLVNKYFINSGELADCVPGVAQATLGTCGGEAAACTSDADCVTNADCVDCGPSCSGATQGNEEVMGTCSGTAAGACSSDADCAGEEGSVCEGYMAAADPAPGTCGGSCYQSSDCVSGVCEGGIVPVESSNPFDADGSGWFDIRDYLVAYGSNMEQALEDWDKNANGMLDPQDLIIHCSDGVDDDGNGYVDDISGWDFFADDNDPYDDNRFGHGNGEARDSVSEGNNGSGDIGVCPDCTALMVRAGDSFVVDANEFAQSVIFAVDSGASVIQEALGSVNNTPFSQDAINYAYDNNVTVIASAADELSYHHNFPGTNNHTVYVHAIQYDGASGDQSTTFLNFNNCTNFGMQLLLSTPGLGCSSEATGISAGHTGLIYAAALKAGVDPPISAEEVKQILTLNVDDINVNPNDDQPTKFKSDEGWDWHFGYGRNNARKTVDAVMGGHIPPEVDIVTPLWFEVIYPDQTPEVEIMGRLNMRRDGKSARYPEVDWTLEYAIGVAPRAGSWTEFASGTTEGREGPLASWNVSDIPLDLDETLTDPHQNAVTVRLRAVAKNEAGEVILNGAGEPLYGEMRKGFLLERDRDLVEGYPRYLGGSGEASPTFADLDGDGAEELIVALSDGHIHAYHHGGGEAAGWPVKLKRRWALDEANPTHVLGSCAFREDKSGCIAGQGVVDSDVRQTMMMPPAIGDIDNDGNLELVVGSWDGWVTVYEHDGTLKEGWPQSVDFSLFLPDKDHVIEPGFFASMVLADLDGEPGLEIIGAAMDQHVYVWHHDGQEMAPYPVKVSSDPEQGARIICSPAVGDIDGDGLMEIAVGTSEIFGAGGNANEARAYVLESETGAIADGWPQSLYGLTVDVLPIVGRGIVTNPILVDLDYDGTLEISFDTISTQGWIFDHDGAIHRKMNNKEFGEGSDSADTPAYILMNNGAIGHVDREGGIDFVKGTAGFDFALAFAGGGERGYFDHQLSGWDLDTGKMMEGFPRVHDDWQFFNTPTIVDINNDNDPEVIVGSAGYLVHAWNYKGEEPEGWPKQTGGWIMAAVAVGDHDGDGLFDAAVTTRDGWLYMWRTPGKASSSIFEWNGTGHDPMRTSNYENSPTPFKVWSAEPAQEVVENDAGRSGCAGGSTSWSWMLLGAGSLMLLRRRL